MSSTTKKYVPPSMRNRKPSPAPPTPKIVANEFPSLGSAASTNNTWKPKMSFATLASQWNEFEEEEAEKRAFQAELEKKRLEDTRMQQRNVVVVGGHKRDLDVVYEYDGEEDVTPSKKDEDDGWTRVERKPRQEFSMEEKMARQERFEAAERSMYDRDSVWNAGGDGYDDWDYRDRRAQT